MPAEAGIQRFAKKWVPAFAGTSGRGLRLALLRLPFLESLAHVSERLAERGVEIAVEARERAILLDIDAHLVHVPQPGAYMHVHHLADREAALAAHLERGV